MFRGVNAITIDAKGRVAVPARYRHLLQETQAGRIVVTIDTEDPCLLLYPVSEWQLIEAKVEALPSFNEATRRIKRLLIGHATELELDGQGRVLLPKHLRDYAQLDKRIAMVGQGKKFEIWCESKWQSQCQGWLDAGAFKNDDMPAELKDLVV